MNTQDKYHGIPADVLADRADFNGADYDYKGFADQSRRLVKTLGEGDKTVHITAIPVGIQFTHKETGEIKDVDAGMLVIALNPYLLADCETHYLNIHEIILDSATQHQMRQLTYPVKMPMAPTDKDIEGKSQEEIDAMNQAWNEKGLESALYLLEELLNDTDSWQFFGDAAHKEAGISRVIFTRKPKCSVEPQSISPFEDSSE